VDRCVQNLRRFVGWDVEYFAAVELPRQKHCANWRPLFAARHNDLQASRGAPITGRHRS